LSFSHRVKIFCDYSPGLPLPPQKRCWSLFSPPPSQRGASSPKGICGKGSNLPFLVKKRSFFSEQCFFFFIRKKKGFLPCPDSPSRVSHHSRGPSRLRLCPTKITGPSFPFRQRHPPLCNASDGFFPDGKPSLSSPPPRRRFLLSSNRRGTTANPIPSGKEQCTLPFPVIKRTPLLAPPAGSKTISPPPSRLRRQGPLSPVEEGEGLLLRPKIREPRDANLFPFGAVLPLFFFSCRSRFSERHFSCRTRALPFS